MMPAPLGFLRSRSHRQGAIVIRPAEAGDYATIDWLTGASPYAYSGLGGSLREALQDDLVLTAWQEDSLAGFAMAHRQGPEAAWVYAFSLAADVSLSQVGRVLVRGLEERLAPAGVTMLGYMDEYGLSWLRRLLEEVGFRRETRVVSYEAPVRRPPSMGNQEVAVRPAGPADIPAVARLDRAAFGPLWAYSERVLRSVLGPLVYFQAAELPGTVCGYMLCTFHQDDRAHVVRIAVDPGLQGQGIGVRLLAEFFLYARTQGVRRVSLNTQEENYRSQQLYRWFGFAPTGEEVGVWVKGFTPAAAGTVPPPAPSSAPRR
jgi:ribosomal-protein-alanine N-acetyltransferase